MLAYIGLEHFDTTQWCCKWHRSSSIWEQIIAALKPPNSAFKLYNKPSEEPDQLYIAVGSDENVKRCQVQPSQSRPQAGVTLEVNPLTASHKSSKLLCVKPASLDHCTSWYVLLYQAVP